MRTALRADRSDDLNTLEREVEQVLVPVQVPDSFSERLRSGLMASAAGQWSLVSSRPPHRWGLIFAAIGGALSALWLVAWITRRERRVSLG